MAAYRRYNAIVKKGPMNWTVKDCRSLAYGQCHYSIPYGPKSPGYNYIIVVQGPKSSCRKSAGPTPMWNIEFDELENEEG